MILDTETLKAEKKELDAKIQRMNAEDTIANPDYPMNSSEFYCPEYLELTDRFLAISQILYNAGLLEKMNEAK